MVSFAHKSTGPNLMVSFAQARASTKATMAAHRLLSENDPLPSKAHHVKPLVLLPITDGCEELEVLTLFDTLTRGGADVVTASVGQTKKNIVAGYHGMKLRAIKPIEDCVYDRYELIVLPGGIGVSQLRDCELLTRMLKLQKQEKRYYAAIDEAPAVVLAAHELIDGHATCHPSKVRFLSEHFVNQDVVVTDKCVTSQGAGTALKFALTLVSLVCSEDEAAQAGKQLLYSIP